ncbi:MAG: cytidylate kinase-like family protein [Desulfosarcinaceae bacterium]|nr:cytidylate kinase-like family protein [Desulfosarcinaceae bacterium]
MAASKQRIEKLIAEQVDKWKTQTKAHVPVITVSTEPGSGGRIVARRVAERLDLDLFDRDIIKSVAESAHLSDKVIQTIEKERLSGIQDFISVLLDDKYLYPGIYLQHLIKVVSVIAKHGHALIVGRGANFIIPPEERLAVRIVAPLSHRMGNVAQAYGVSDEEARQRIRNREKRRASFVRNAFKADVTETGNYDLVISTEHIDLNAAVGAIVGCLVGTQDGPRTG